MQTRLNPYLSFKSNARQDMEFYKTVFGGKLQLSTFKEYHASQTTDEDDLIMHAELNAGESLLFMVSDTPARMEYHPGTNMSMSLTGENEAELKTYF
jgi:PhnB protein